MAAVCRSRGFRFWHAVFGVHVQARDKASQASRTLASLLGTCQARERVPAPEPRAQRGALYTPNSSKVRSSEIWAQSFEPASFYICHAELDVLC